MRPVVGARKRFSEMAGALKPRRPPKIRTCFCRPILMALLFCSPFAGAYDCGKCRLAGNCSSSAAMTLVAPRGVHALMRMAVVGRRSFSLDDKAVDAPALIVGERPIAALQSGRDVAGARPSRPEPLAPRPSRLACRKAPATNVDLRLKAACNTDLRTRCRALDHTGLRPARRRPWRFAAGVSRA